MIAAAPWTGCTTAGRQLGTFHDASRIPAGRSTAFRIDRLRKVLSSMHAIKPTSGIEGSAGGEKAPEPSADAGALLKRASAGTTTSRSSSNSVAHAM
jgi:hypothetical protein